MEGGEIDEIKFLFYCYKDSDYGIIQTNERG